MPAEYFIPDSQLLKLIFNNDFTNDDDIFNFLKLYLENYDECLKKITNIYETNNKNIIAKKK